MTLSDIELYEADIQYAVSAKKATKKVWEYWRRQIGRLAAEQIYHKLGVENPEDD